MAASGAGFSQRMLRSITDDGAHHDGIYLNDCSNAVRNAHNVFPSSITGTPGHPDEGVVLEGGKEETGWLE